MRYDTRSGARTRIGKVLLDIKGDLHYTKTRHSTLKMKRNNLILTKANKGNTIVVMDKDDYIKNVE